MEISNNQTTDLQRKIERIAFPLLLACFCFANVNKGLTLTDTGYNLGNFKFLSGLDGMWYYSTLLSNLTGALLTHLPGGSTMLGISIYATLIKVLMALVPYYFFTRVCYIKRKTAFLGILFSVSLCWAPAVCLYHYLSYDLLGLGAMLLFIGHARKQSYCLVIAGALLGLNVFVRFPNVTNVALIAALWAIAFLEKEDVKKTLQETLLCIAGYVGTLVVVFTVIFLRRHMNDYIVGISDLFGMTEAAEGYTSSGMIRTILSAYVGLMYWGKYVLLVLAAFVGWGILAYRRLPKKVATMGSYILAGVVTVLMFVWFYITGLFTLNFSNYSSMYGPAGICLILIIGLLIYDLIINPNNDERFLDLIAFVVLVITPLGSNNALYTNYNNMFLIFPVSLHILIKMFKKETLLALSTGLSVLFAGFGILFILFGATFVFRDGSDGKMAYTVENNEVLKGMKTNAENAVVLSELTAIVKEHAPGDTRLLLMGDVPALSYFLDKKPAISSTWPSLDSYSASKFKEELSNLDAICAEKEWYPLIVWDGWNGNEEKVLALTEFMERYQYRAIYENNNLVVYKSDLQR